MVWKAGFLEKTFFFWDFLYGRKLLIQSFPSCFAERGELLNLFGTEHVGGN